MHNLLGENLEPRHAIGGGVRDLVEERVRLSLTLLHGDALEGGDGGDPVLDHLALRHRRPERVVEADNDIDEPRQVTVATHPDRVERLLIQATVQFGPGLCRLDPLNVGHKAPQGVPVEGIRRGVGRDAAPFDSPPLFDIVPDDHEGVVRDGHRREGVEDHPPGVLRRRDGNRAEALDPLVGHPIHDIRVDVLPVARESAEFRNGGGATGTGGGGSVTGRVREGGVKPRTVDGDLVLVKLVPSPDRVEPGGPAGGPHLDRPNRHPVLGVILAVTLTIRRAGDVIVLTPGVPRPPRVAHDVEASAGGVDTRTVLNIRHVLTAVNPTQAEVWRPDWVSRRGTVRAPDVIAGERDTEVVSLHVVSTRKRLRLMVG